jgi:hypothetical protein
MTGSHRWLSVVLAGVLAGSLVGCAGGKNGSIKDATPGKPDEVVAGQVTAALTRATSCDDLLSRIQADVSAKIVLQAELMRAGEQYANHGGVVGQGTGGIGFANEARTGAPPLPTAGMAAAPSIPASGASGAPSNSGPSSAGSAGSAPSSNPTTPQMAAPGKSAADQPAVLGPSGHSDTNVQVKGVDEADIVKTDGDHIFLLHGNQLYVLTSWPANQTAIQGKTTIEGSANEMFVQNGVAVVFSNTYDQGDLVDAPPPASTMAGVSPNPYAYYGTAFTKITLIKVGTGAPQVVRELFVEGNYLSARRYDKTVRAVIQGGFRTPPIYAGNVEYTDPWGRKYPQEQIDQQVNSWRDRMIAAISTTKLSDWLPIERELTAGTLSKPARRCTDFYAPSPGLTDYGLTNIVSFDMQDPKSALGGALVLGNADEVYSNESVMLLASRDYRWDQGLIERERTVLHRFELDGANTTYNSSGFVPGQIVDQFSLDEANGVVRVATSARLWQNFMPPLPPLAAVAVKQDDLPKDGSGVATLARQTDNRVVTLRASGEKLVRAGITEPLGNDGEVLKSSRFVGDRAYVVTFHQTDPLMVIDLSKPEKLVKLGELDIPGFSDYMQPIDKDNLLTIGRDTDASGVDRGLMLQLFDVSDATAPRRSHTYKFGPNGYSEANTNHKAFTFFKPDGAVGYDGLLAFPYVNNGYPFSSSLEVFKVSVKDGFTLLGAIDHTQLLQNVCGMFNSGNSGAPIYFNGCVQPEVRRGLFILGRGEDFVYSISNGGVLVHALTDLMTAVATVPLPQPDYGDHRVCHGAADLCAMGFGGTGTSKAVPGGVVISGGGPTPQVDPAQPPPPMGGTPVIPTMPAQPPAADGGAPVPQDAGMAMGSAGAGAGL